MDSDLAQQHAAALARRIIGCTEAEARAVAGNEGCPVRVARRDGEWFMLTMDYVANRVTVEIEDGLIVVAKARG